MSVVQSIRKRLTARPRLFDAAKRLTRLCGATNLVFESLRAFAVSERNACFLQIGSNDGLTNDPIREFVVANPGWRGAFVEPVPHLYENLKRNYAYLKRRSLSFFNCAVFAGEATITLYHINPRRVGEYTAMADQIASFDRQHILKHYPRHPTIDSDIVAVTVPCRSVTQILSLASLPTLDLLHVDIEGAEAMVFQEFPFAHIRPKMLVYEWIHMREQDRGSLETRLREIGYALDSDSFDTVATLRK